MTLNIKSTKILKIDVKIHGEIYFFFEQKPFIFARKSTVTSLRIFF